jgi:serine/threonine protein kinase
MPLTPNAHFGKYTIIGPLGRGGMATVYKAFEPGLDRLVAVKTLPPDLLTESTFADRFRREAQVIARLEHPHIVPVFAYGIDEGTPWMAMRLVTGGSLASLMLAARLPIPRAIKILRGVADALHYAHVHGVVHRDVKPQNVLLDQEGYPYLSDFGIARLAQDSQWSVASVSITKGVVGTPYYMAPEQVMGEAVDQRCDVYALGILAYEIFAGSVPFKGDTPVKVLMKHLYEPVPVPDASEVPTSLMNPVLRALEKDAASRWSSPVQFVNALETAVAGGEDPARGTTITQLHERLGVVGAGPIGHGSEGRPVRRSLAKSSLVLVIAVLGTGAAVGFWHVRRTRLPPQEELDGQTRSEPPTLSSPAHPTGTIELPSPVPGRSPTPPSTPQPTPLDAQVESRPRDTAVSAARTQLAATPNPSPPARTTLAVEDQRQTSAIEGVELSEDALWEAIKFSAAPEPFVDYLRRYPEGRHAVSARANLQLTVNAPLSKRGSPTQSSQDASTTALPSPPPEPAQSTSPAQRTPLLPAFKAEYKDAQGREGIALVTAVRDGVLVQMYDQKLIPWNEVREVRGGGFLGHTLLLVTSTGTHKLTVSNAKQLASALNDLKRLQGSP